MATQLYRFSVLLGVMLSIMCPTSTSAAWKMPPEYFDVGSTIPASGPFIFLDHNRCKNQEDVYSLTSVDISGLESTPLTITLK